MTARVIALGMVAAGLAFGVTGWVVGLPHEAAPAPTVVASVPPGAYLDATGHLVTPVSNPAPANAAGSSTTGSSTTGSSVHPGITVQATWLESTSRETGIPQRALEAYAGAALRVEQTDPGCNLAWNTLAAIGSVESDNGTAGGTHIEADGEISGRIEGPLLDGTDGTAAVRSSLSTGSTTWARAIGPMQMLPSTWERYGVDANGDGRKDPNNIDDAALGAGDYLCAAGGDLAAASGWNAAILAYNHVASYVDAIRRRADLYATETSD